MKSASGAKAAKEAAAAKRAPRAPKVDAGIAGAMGSGGAAKNGDDPLGPGGDDLTDIMRGNGAVEVPTPEPDWTPPAPARKPSNLLNRPQWAGLGDTPMPEGLAVSQVRFKVGKLVAWRSTSTLNVRDPKLRGIKMVLAGPLLWIERVKEVSRGRNRRGVWAVSVVDLGEITFPEEEG